jgi:hypothetical protein
VEGLVLFLWTLACAAPFEGSPDVTSPTFEDQGADSDPTTDSRDSGSPDSGSTVPDDTGEPVDTQPDSEPDPSD